MIRPLSRRKGGAVQARTTPTPVLAVVYLAALIGCIGYFPYFVWSLWAAIWDKFGVVVKIPEILVF
jgi:Sec-independent protein secretion pathway component TatC